MEQQPCNNNHYESKARRIIPKSGVILLRAIKIGVKRIITLSPYKFILLSFVINLLVSLGGSILLDIYYPGSFTNSFLEELSQMEIFVMVVLIAPILETLVFQFIIIELTLYINSKATYGAILISGILFGLSHNFNAIYILLSIGTGILLSTNYILCRKRKDLNSYWLIVGIHAGLNMITFIINSYF